MAGPSDSTAEGTEEVLSDETMLSQADALTLGKAGWHSDISGRND
jgi:hypothetical protein